MSLMDITFCPLDIGLTEDQRHRMLLEIGSLSEASWYHNQFRQCLMLPLMNRGGHMTSLQIAQDKQTEFMWTPAARDCPTVIEVLTHNVFPWMEQPSRVTVLKTSPQARLNIHVDCTAQEVGTLQHKFRIVLNGETSDLFFVDRNGNPVWAPSQQPIYVLDGGHPHASVNRSTEERFILCVASPWKGENARYQEMLTTQSHKSLRILRPPLEKEWCDLQRFGGY